MHNNISQRNVISEKFDVALSTDDNGRIQKYRISSSGGSLSMRQVLGLWQNDEHFVDVYTSLFKECGFSAYVWEMPPLSTSSLDKPFEFVLINMSFQQSVPDTHTFREFFDAHAKNHGVVSFLNLGQDAMLVVPSPLCQDANYSSLAAFFAEAPRKQQRALWKATAEQISKLLSDEKLWVSVAGGGVSWLHIRLDSRPKYYRYRQYATL